MRKIDDSRRRMLRSAVLVLAVAPLVRTPPAAAAANPALRAQLQYQDKPNGEMRCDNCVDFIPGPDGTAPGGCTRIPGDDEIRPEGYCNAWNTM